MSRTQRRPLGQSGRLHAIGGEWLPRSVHRRTDVLLAIPNPNQTLEGFERFHHRDLPDLTDTELRRELWLLTDAVFRAIQPHSWQRERVERLQDERRLRERQVRRG